ncbi:MAG: sialate O-acetylesterase, partial [Gemmataceae bacterium]
RAGRGILLDSPRDYQVFQRDHRNQAKVRVSGKLGDAARKADSLQVRYGMANKPGVWQELKSSLKDGMFEAVLEMPAGGWYVFSVRAMREGQVLATSHVEHLGVGEVFVVAGQSNSANHGEERQRTRSKKVATFDGTQWHLGHDPQPGASGDGGSFLPPLGDILAEKLKVPVGMVSCGVGATSVREWLPSGIPFANPPTIEGRVRKRPDGQWESRGDLYVLLRDRMKVLGPNGFRAVLWHQGESDANQQDRTRTLPGQRYREYLEKIIRESRKDTNWPAPWFVAQVSYHTPEDTGSPDIRAAQASLWKDRLALEGPDSDALRGEFRDGAGRGVHFSGKGLREHAARWADKIIPWIEQRQGGPANAP